MRHENSDGDGREGEIGDWRRFYFGLGRGGMRCREGESVR